MSGFCSINDFLVHISTSRRRWNILVVRYMVPEVDEVLRWISIRLSCYVDEAPGWVLLIMPLCFQLPLNMSLDFFLVTTHLPQAVQSHCPPLRMVIAPSLEEGQKRSETSGRPER